MTRAEWLAAHPTHRENKLRAHMRFLATLDRWERLWWEWRREDSVLPPGGVGWVGSSLHGDRWVRHRPEFKTR